MSSTDGYEARAIGWRDPLDSDLVRYQSSVVHDGEGGDLRRWNVRTADRSDPARLWIEHALRSILGPDASGRSRDVLGPVVYRSRPRALRVARRKIRQLRRAAVPFEEVEG